MEILKRNWEQTQPPAPEPFKHSDSLKKSSAYQDNSIFTLAAIFKDGNRFRAHSWRQEVRGKKRLVDHKNAWLRLYNLATTCTCGKNPVNKCFVCNHTVIMIYCNLNDNLLFKSTYKNVKVTSDLGFITNDKTGSVFLSSINGKSIKAQSFEHAKKNFIFTQKFEP
jgi:hypothetical protein